VNRILGIGGVTNSLPPMVFNCDGTGENTISFANFKTNGVTWTFVSVEDSDMVESSNYTVFGASIQMYLETLAPEGQYFIDVLFEDAGSGDDERIGGDNDAGFSLPSEPEENLFEFAAVIVEGGKVRIPYSAKGAVTNIANEIEIKVIASTNLLTSNIELLATIDFSGMVAATAEDANEDISGEIEIDLEDVLNLATPEEAPPVMFFRGIKVD